MNSSEEMILMLILCCLVSSTSHAFPLQNFCKADLNGPKSPAGYNCLPYDAVTAADFKYSFNGAPSIAVPSNTVLFPASVNEVPILNGLGISGGCVEIEEGGIVPVHDHAATEIMLVQQGEITVGLFTPRKAYQNTLRQGDLVVFPEGLRHYLINSGTGKATAFAAFSSANPRLRFLPIELSANDVPSAIIARTTFLDEPQVRKLKAFFNGTG